MYFSCVQVEAGVCSEWVQVSGLLPPLSVGEATTIGTAYLVLMITCWGISLVAKQLIPR